MHYLELTEFLFFQDGLQKEAEFKQLAWSARSTKHFETLHNGKTVIGVRQVFPKRVTYIYILDILAYINREHNWVSNPTLGCSIVISHDIYIYIYNMYVGLSTIVYGKPIQKIVC